MTHKHKIAFCIPTYNRYLQLDRLLRYFCEVKNVLPNYQIVISDNASTDKTESVVTNYQHQLPITYHKKEITISAEQNMLCALHKAESQYLMYIADDDLFIPNRIKEIVNIMDSNINIAGYFAPFEWYDATNEVAISKVFTTTKELTFERNSYSKLIDFILSNNAIPENGVFRSELFMQIHEPRNFTFFLLTRLGHIISNGLIIISNNPFYRFVARPDIDGERQQEGKRLTMTDWDSYRGGIEYLYRLSWLHETQTVNYSNSYSIESFIAHRMLTALHLWIRSNNHIEAYSLYNRLKVMLRNFPPNSSLHRLLESHKPDIHILINEAISDIFYTLKPIERIELRGLKDSTRLLSHLIISGIAKQVSIYAAGIHYVNHAHAADKILAITESENERRIAIKLGYLEGMTYSLEFMMKNYSSAVLD